MNRLARRLATVATAALMATPALALPATTANASVPAINAQSFGMHWLVTSHAYPNMPFASARIWGGDAPTWKDLQPSGPTPVYSTDLLGNQTQTGWNPAAWDQAALDRLDAIVNTFVSHHVDPMITLGMTPSWAADTSNCAHVDSSGYDWGTETCPPVAQAVDGTDPWSAYVTYLANRYSGKVHYFELWNEPSLRNGYNGNVTRLAQMQDQAYGILHSYGDKLVSPSIPFTNGTASNPTGPGIAWLKSFLAQSGGKSFDITGLHLYPSDGAVKGRIGPEWAVNTALAQAKKVLSSYGIGGRQIWDTETNVGRIPAGTYVGGGTEGAADVARTFILATQSHVARTLWYAADDRAWGGVQLEGTNYSSLTTAGYAERTVRNLLVGKAPLGCARTTIAANKWKYTCKFGTTTGHKTLLAVWTTGGNYALKAPAGVRYSYTVTGARHSAYTGKKFTISHTPVYFYGSFK